MAEQKMLPSERRAMKRREAAQKAEAVFGTGKGSTEPMLNAMDYTASLVKALNHYNTAFDDKTKRKWVYAYIGQVKNKSSELDILSDWEFSSLGTIIRLKQREQPLQDKELAFIDARLNLLRAKAKSLIENAPKEKVAEKKAAVPKVDKNAEAASYHIGEIMGIIDDFIMYDKEVDIAAYLKSNEVTAQVAKLIPQAFESNIAEIELAIKGSDKDLVEGYSNFKKVKLRRLMNAYKSIAEACDQQVVTVKVARKPRIKKEKPASVLAAKVKYLKEDQELNVKSEQPAKIVGAAEVWIFNTKYKKLQVYRADDAQKLSIKGTTITGYSVSKSSAKTLRKPESVVEYAKMTKKTFEQAYKSLKTKESPVNGRINEFCLILKVI